MTAASVTPSSHVSGGRSVSDGIIRALDLVIAVATLLALAPLLLAIALAIRGSSPGPALFRQRRVGRDQRPFSMLKFRTMRTEAPEAPHREYVEQLLGGSAETADSASDGLYKLVVDERVTPLGRFLRRMSLDELPQLWNVVLGQMSLVGPRPVIPYEVVLYPPDYVDRFAVKPGLTGLWQVSGRNRHTYREMVQLDIEYVQRRSLRLYLAVLLRTLPAVIRGNSA